jgi:glutathione S-transferase
MFTLYSRPGSGSAAVEALLTEMALPFQVVDVPRGPSADYLLINPRGEIPSLRLPDNSLMTESAAMMIYLADLDHSKNLAPSVSSENRGTYLRWMLYFASTVYASDLRYFYPDRFVANKEHGHEVKSQAVIALAKDYQVFADFLGGQDFVLGQKFSAVDLYAAMLITWAPDLDALFLKHPNLKDYYFRVAARPKTAPAWKRNEMPLA